MGSRSSSYSGSSMKVHQLTRGFWEHEPSLSLGCKRLRPLAPKFITTATTNLSITHDTNNIINITTTPITSSLDLKSFIRADCGPRKIGSSSIDQETKTHSIQVEAQSGGTRWNPTQEQIGILEMLYKGGMRTPNAQQIEHITDQLSNYGKIEGKNVFYWFQNHKARERQKQKRSSLGLPHSPRTPPPANTKILDASTLQGGLESEEDNNYYNKWKYRSLGASGFEEDNNNMLHKSLSSSSLSSEEEEEEGRGGGDKTLELFPLHPEGR